MKKFIISISLVLLLFVAFFLMLILTETPMNISLIGSGVATLIACPYLGLTVMGKPLKAASTNMDKLTGWKKVGFFVGMLIVTLSVNGTLLETKDATIETLPFTFYGIAFIVAVFVCNILQQGFTLRSYPDYSIPPNAPVYAVYH